MISNNANAGTGKSILDGKEYDYVFNIDIGDGIPALKLPFNNTQDPYLVAQVFFMITNTYRFLGPRYTPIAELYIED